MRKQLAKRAGGGPCWATRRAGEGVKHSIPCSPSLLTNKQRVRLQVQRAIAAADSLADAAAGGGGKKGASPARPAALDWDLQVGGGHGGQGQSGVDSGWGGVGSSVQHAAWRG